MSFESIGAISRYTGYLQAFISIGLAVRLAIMLSRAQTDDDINIGKEVKTTIAAGIVILIIPSIIRLFYSYY